MLSKLHWQKRSNRKSQQSFEGHSLSPQASPELESEGAPANPSSRRPGFLSRVRSQRFSTVNVQPESSHQEASSNPVPNKRHSYYQPAQPLYDTVEAQHPV
ncbi:uncharacterized protein M437DRAFT_57464 [Aureobasidium melanogenum CBS 110374]|uniref:Uncharacterized protein n=1 Tax=Aureobasidium melanogenum (strain CBS 110374) TaxID=1043003 RepID=A0A074VFF0_AURM1|nr:uncharacterized protein M437DRAFT_57464 [Aureobasidium melanogenum CBS 110374]KEQ59153.1 hypothetical protein M437DRAFT_57464 [Aureobasidium melanogenum CBS 110374]